MDIEWAHCLVGKDWEIFWDNGADDDNDDGGGTEAESATPMHYAIVPNSLGRGSTPNTLGVPSIPQPPVEYDALLPFTTEGLLINIAFENGCVVFKNYRHFSDGTMGPAQGNGLIRNSGDIIVGIDGVSTVGRGFGDVVAMLGASGATRSVVVVRFRAADLPNAAPTNNVNGNLPKVDEAVEKDEPADDDDEAVDDHGDISDWYDGRILGYQVTTSGCSFNIRFVGDDHIFTMALSQTNVRPSARAWLMRTKALLSSRGIEQWESSLPVDTSSHQDRAHLEELRKQYPPQHTAFAPQPLNDGSRLPYPTVDRFNQVQTLHYFVKAQLYLRTKLAPVVEIGEKHEDEPTEAYVSYLVSCLERLDASCAWYSKCWRLSQHVFSIDGLPERLAVEYLRAGCVEAGRDAIFSIARADITPVGMKRPPPSPSGARRTKRRRIQRDPSHFVASTKGCSTDEDMDYLSDLDEGQFLSIRAVDRFAKKLKHEGKTWFKEFCLEMLRSLTRYIQDPVARWIGEAQRMLGERKVSDDDQSSTGTSVEDQDETEGREDDDSMEIEESVYSYEAVKAILGKIQTHPVLCKFNLARWTSKLERKVTLIEEFEQEAWKIISKIADGTIDTGNNGDPVLAELTILNDQIYAPDSLLGNVAPLAVSPDSKMTKEVIEDAKLIRQWVVDLTQAERHRERVTFIQDVSARAANLPHIPCVPGEPLGESSLSGKLGKVFARVQNVSAKLFSNVHTVTQYERHLAESSDPKTDTEGLRTLDGIEKALRALALIPVLSLVEEKLSVRRDLFVWVGTTKSLLSKTIGESVPFQQVESCFRDLTNILAATSNARKQVTKGLVRREVIEKELRHFVRKDVDELSDSVGPKLEALYMRAGSWKERAEAVIFALRVYGNPLAGEPLSSSRATAMVDCKRMSDLLDEYAFLDLSMDELHDVVQAVITETMTWSEKVNSGILQEHNLLHFLTTCRNDRPTGVIVDPARHTLDIVVDLLEWHDQVKKKISVISVARNFDELYSLVADGVDVIEQYAQNWTAGKGFQFGRAVVADFVGVTAGSNKQTKIPALAKVQSTALGKSVLDRLISQSFDELEGFPMFSLLYIAWAIDVSHFVSTVTTESSCVRPTLVDALSLAEKEPNKADVDTKILLNDELQYGVTKLALLVDEYKSIEDAAKKIIAPGREEFRGSLEKADGVRAYLTSLKQVQLTFKTPKQGGKGLILDAELEKSVDKLTKELSWFVRTLAIPLLHSNANEVPSTQRISWADLVSLFERIPASGDCLIGDIPRVVLRVRELHESAIMWQDQVSSLLSLSIRGAKRRQVGSQEGDLAGKEGSSKMSNVKLGELVEDPILAMVAIPRETAVREVLNKTREFEKMMYDLLVRDYTDTSADKGPYPEALSLAGTNGEFHLYRLTGSSQFSALKVSLEKMGLVSSDIVADTPGKEAFEWINQCVKWIESLNSAVTEESPFGATNRLVVPVQEASAILNVGNQLFLDISDDVRRTLSTRRIIVSTNKQSEKLTITIAKGGAHHSTGGTALKWCPLIFEWLKNDIDEHQRWIDRTGEILNTVSAYSRVAHSQESLNLSYQSFEDLRTHLDEGRNSLVVVPEKSIIDHMLNAQRLLDTFIQLATSEPTGKLSLKVAKANRYENPITAVGEREFFLDALLVRRRIQASAKREPSIVNTAGNGFREKARMKLDKVMRKGMRMMGFGIQGAQDVGLHCTMKAWEIESTAFSKFRDGEMSVKSGYTDKIMSIVNNLDAIKNPTLCAKALTAELTAETLLDMTTEELAGQNVREKKAQAEAASKRNIIIAAGKSKSSTQKGKTVKNLLSKVSSLASPKVSKPSHAARPAPHSQPNDTEETPLPSPGFPQQARATRSAMPSSGDFSPPSREGSPPLDPLSIANALQVSQRRVAVLPAAPPLSLSAHHTHQAVASPEATSNDSTVISESGADRFMFTIEKQAFEAKLVLDDGSLAAINRFLPDDMSMRGRSRIEEFTKFLSDKLKTGNSSATALRVSISDEWKDNYKKFYREFEKKGRIAMFKVNEGKLFLVTPKYHSAAKEIRSQLRSRHHTYAVVIKKHFHFDD